MNWDLLNDGMGNPKNVKSMLLAHETPRAMWLGVRPDAEAVKKSGARRPTCMMSAPPPFKTCCVRKIMPEF